MELAEQLMRAERRDEASAAIERVLRLDPDNAAAQFREGQNRVMAFEYFELEGDRAVRYSFQVLPMEQDKPPLYRISLGSYEFTNEHVRAMGDIGADERLFHLDGYYPGGEHRTFAFSSRSRAMTRHARWLST